jgi:peptide/nickel transport system permease protein
MKMSRSRNAIGKTYFRLIAKPIVLTLLFFIIIISTYYLVILVKGSPQRAFLKPGMTAQQKLRESARVSSLESWLTNLLQGNFGWSVQTGTWVSEGLYWRLGYTLLLVGSSIVMSILTGIILVLLFLFLRRRGFKPLVFAHSLNGFFFGLIALVSLVSIYFFTYLLVNYGIRVFPLTATLDALERVHLSGVQLYATIAWHMTLPVLMLGLVAFIRNIFVIGGSGSLFSSEDRYKNLLLPITTLDFGFAISCAIIIELLFRVQGLGSWFIYSLNESVADYNAAIASFIMLLGIAVVLELASIPLDILRRTSGLHEELERKSVAKPKINRHQRRDEHKVLKRKTFWIGLTIVIFFVLLGALAPWITAGVDPERNFVADSYAYPEWYANLVPALRNLPRTTDALLDWTVENRSLLPDFVTVNQTSNGWRIKCNGTTQVQILFVTKWNYTWDPPKHFDFTFSYGADPGTPATASYALALNLTTPAGGNKTNKLWGNTYPIWDAFSWRYQIYNQPIRYDQIPSNPAYKRLGYPFLNSGSNASIDINPMPLFYRLGYKPVTYATEMLPDLFGPPGEFTFKMYVTINPKGKTNTMCEISLSKFGIHILGLVYGLLGTQVYGSDCWSRLVYGARMTLGVASLVAALAVFIGFPFGFVAGYFENWTDNIVMTFVDAILSFPVLPFIIFIVAFIGRNWLFISLIPLGFLSALTTKAFRYKYLIRPPNQKLKGDSEENPAVDFVKGILGNFCLTMASVILLLSTIDFLGFGDPTLPTWGRELNLAFSEGSGFSQFIWWWVMFPIVFIGLFALGFLLLGESLDDRRDQGEDVHS